MRNVTRSIFMLLLYGLCLSVGAGYAETKKPNILVIMGDDVGITNISAYSHGLMGYQTPNIARIAMPSSDQCSRTRSHVAMNTVTANAEQACDMGGAMYM